jgi:hypothetical protein
VARERAACGNGGLGANIGARPWDQRSQWGTGVRARSAARPTRPCEPARFENSSDPVQTRFLPFFQLKWSKV